MEEESLQHHELEPTSVWGITKVCLHEEQEPDMPYLPGQRWKPPRKTQSIRPVVSTPVRFRKNEQRALDGEHMEITLGQILVNLHVTTADFNEKAFVHLVQFRYRNKCNYALAAPTVIMTDSTGAPTYGSSFNKISEAILKDRQLPVWFLPPDRLLQPRDESTGWVVFDQVARDSNEFKGIGNTTNEVPVHLKLALVLFEEPGQTTGRMKGEEIFEFTLRP
jgi:hypothetical protein